MKDMILNHLGPKQKTLLKRAGKIAESMGMQAYLVGGVVRDLWLGHVSPDMDIVVTGDGIHFAKHLADSVQGQVKTYPRFRTATITLGSGITLDCVTARSEYYPAPGALPEVEPSTLKQDPFRRDFTINSLAVSLSRKSYGQIIDPYNGLMDLKKKKIRVLHEKSFYDDPTRIFRAARFLERFGFSLELKTVRQLGSAVRTSAVKTVTSTRLFHEMVKIFEEDKVSVVLRRLTQWKIKHALLQKEVLPLTIFRRIERRRKRLSQTKQFAQVCWKDIFLTAFFAGLSRTGRDRMFQDVQMSKKNQKAVLARMAFHKELERTASKASGVCGALWNTEDAESLAYALAVTDKTHLLKRIV